MAKVNIVRNFNVSEAIAEIDGDRLKQVFWNLSDNAMRAMPNGGSLTVSLQQQGSDWQISFSDTGTGIAQPEMEKIFEPFHSSFSGGTGLGLAIVYQILQAHDAKISVQSKAGSGTDFVINLKRAAAGVKQESIAAGNAANSGFSPRSKVKVGGVRG
jgi:signal transduction histidine kinase